MDVRSYRDLEVWQRAMVVAEECYSITRSFPRDEAFGLTSQIRRASVSVAANIAEGYGRETTASFIQFLRVAQGSQKELDTHLLVSQRVGLLDESKAPPLLDDLGRLGRMLRGLIRSLEAKRRSSI